MKSSRALMKGLAASIKCIEASAERISTNALHGAGFVGSAEVTLSSSSGSLCRAPQELLEALPLQPRVASAALSCIPSHAVTDPMPSLRDGSCHAEEQIPTPAPNGVLPDPLQSNLLFNPLRRSSSAAPASVCAREPVTPSSGASSLGAPCMSSWHDSASLPPKHMRSSMRQYHTRRLSIVTASSNGRKAFFVDTLALVRRLEAEGLTAKQSEAITQVITDVLHESLESAAHTFVSKAEMQKSELLADAAISKLRTELQSASDIRLAGIQREVESLGTDLDKVKSELKYEVDKVTAGQRLDLNLERGRVKEELNEHAQETSVLSNKLDREINGLKAQLEAAKFDVIRYCVGTLVSVSAVALGLLRILM